VPLSTAVERVGGLQTQYAPTAYIGLWSRLERFRRDDLTRALERRTVVQGTLMRATIHIVSARDYPLFAEAVRRTRREWWLSVTRGRDQVRKVQAATRRVQALLADGPRRRQELIAELGGDGTAWSGVQMWVDLVRVPPSGTWDRRRADLFALADDWLGRASTVSEHDAVDHLVRRYLGGFGPASRKDVQSFTGLSAKALASSFERLSPRRFRDEHGRELLDVPRAPLPDPETEAPPRFLGPWEAALLVHARRTQILPERHRPRVFHVKVPQSVSTFLVDGRVAGAWTFEGGRIELEPFEKLSRQAKRDLDEETERLSAFLA
jgi:Winged helix DNA-binding domain